MTRPDATPLLSTIHVPTLVLVGEEDTLTPPRDEPGACSRAIERIPSSCSIPDAGHLSNLEQPEAFNARARAIPRATGYMS